MISQTAKRFGTGEEAIVIMCPSDNWSVCRVIDVQPERPYGVDGAVS